VSSLENLKCKSKYLSSGGSGFVEEGRERRYNWDDGKWLDLILMTILEEEWDIQRGV
jgi:L-amino acid N-acyltransferase YncA